MDLAFCQQCIPRRNNRRFGESLSVDSKHKKVCPACPPRVERLLRQMHYNSLACDQDVAVVAAGGDLMNRRNLAGLCRLFSVSHEYTNDVMALFQQQVRSDTAIHAAGHC